MDRQMVLVADEGMRTLMDGVKTNAPYFLAVNDELWQAWREIQARGTGEEQGAWFAKGWRIFSRCHPNGSSVMTLEVRFDPPDDD